MKNIFVLLLITSISCNDSFVETPIIKKCEFQQSKKYESLMPQLNGNWKLQIIQINKDDQNIGAYEIFQCEDLPSLIRNSISLNLSFNEKLYIEKNLCNSTTQSFGKLLWVETNDPVHNVMYTIEEYDDDCIKRNEFSFSTDGNILFIYQEIDNLIIYLRYDKF